MKEGLGADFLFELETFFESPHQIPNSYSFYHKPIREGKLKRFPYLVVYEFFDATSTIVVYSVSMAKQNPGKKRIV